MVRAPLGLTQALRRRCECVRLKWAHSSDDRHTETDQQPSSIIAHEARRSANGATLQYGLYFDYFN